MAWPLHKSYTYAPLYAQHSVTARQRAAAAALQQLLLLFFQLRVSLSTMSIPSCLLRQPVALRKYYFSYFAFNFVARRRRSLLSLSLFAILFINVS